jgi:hypothetical protein
MNDARFPLLVNGAEHTILDHCPTARQIHALANNHPIDEHVLIHVLNGISRSIGLDETVTLSPEGNVFHSFQADRTFNFTLDGQGCEWGASLISAHTLYSISGLDSDRYGFELEQVGEDIEITANGQVCLSDQGTEHIRSFSWLVEVCFNGEGRFVRRGKHLVEELMRLLGVENGYKLVVFEGGGLRDLVPTDEITIRPGMKLFSHVLCGQFS